MQTNSVPSGWRDLLLSESKRWVIQLVIMLGAIPYVGVLGFASGILFDNSKFIKEFEWIGAVIGLAMFFFYYLISLGLHLIFDKKKIFSSSPMLSIRPYLTILVVIQALATWGVFVAIPREVRDFILEFFKPIKNSSLPLLLISSILLTWLLSEWVCRFQRWRGRVNPASLAKDVK